MLHAGHRALLNAAFSLGRKVYIGLTSDAMASAQRRVLNPYSVRLRRLKRFCSSYKGRYVIEELNDPFGASVTMGELEAIVVSELTFFRVPEINRIRLQRGMRPLDAYTVTMVRTIDGTPLSSTRILSGECDSEGRLLRRLKISAGTSNRAKLRGIKEAFSLLTGKYFSSFSLKSTDARTTVPAQPWGEETVRGAKERAIAAAEKGDLGIGVEAGLFETPYGQTFDIQFCAVADRAGRVTLGHGIGFTYPPDILSSVRSGKSVGEAMEDLTSIRNIGSRMGAVGYLSSGALDRSSITRDAVIAAMIPRMNPGLYFGEGTLLKEGAEGEI